MVHFTKVKSTFLTSVYGIFHDFILLGYICYIVKSLRIHLQNGNIEVNVYRSKIGLLGYVVKNEM